MPPVTIGRVIALLVVVAVLVLVLTSQMPLLTGLLIGALGVAFVIG